MWLSHFFICNIAAPIINTRSRLRDSPNKLLADGLYSYLDVVNHVLATYATNEVIAEPVCDITSSAELSNATSTLYA